VRKLCPNCKLWNNRGSVECRHCGLRFARLFGPPTLAVNSPIHVPYSVHVPGGWCEACGYVLHVFRRQCPNCGSVVGHGQYAWSAYQPGAGVVSARRRDRSMQFIVARQAQVAAHFCVGLAGGFICSSMGTVLAYAGQTDAALPAAVSGWIVGLIAYRSMRPFDLACSRGLGIGTLLGQLAFIGSQYLLPALSVILQSVFGPIGIGISSP